MTGTNSNLPDKTYIFIRIIDDYDTTCLVKTSSDNTFDCTASIVNGLFRHNFRSAYYAHTHIHTHTHTH